MSSLVKLATILTTDNTEKNWNAFRFGNLALKNGEYVRVFLLGEGVEYLKVKNDKLDIQRQVNAVLEFDKGKIPACETCMDIRHQEGNETCPQSGMKELYGLVKNSNKVLTV